MTDTAKRFAAIRGDLGLSQTEMAEKAGVQRDSWRRYEAGALPNGETLERIAAMGFSIDWLLTGKGEMRSGSSNGAQHSNAIRLDLEERFDKFESFLERVAAPISEERLMASAELMAIRDELRHMASSQEVPQKYQRRADLMLDLAFGEMAAAERRGTAILRALPEYPIPQELLEAIDFVISLLKKGPRNYAVAHFNVLHLASLIDEILKRREMESKSDPTKTSMP